MNALRPALSLAFVGAALAAQANLIDFNGHAGTVGDAYLASDGVSFANAEFFTYSGRPVLLPTAATVTVSSPVNRLMGSVGFVYASNSVGSGPNVATPTFSVYSGIDGTGTLLATALLPDTSRDFSVYAPVSLSFVGAARSFVLHDAAYTHILVDDLSFNPVPEPSAFAALGLGATALLRRRRRYSSS